MIKFTKMEGLGNDYVYVDCTEKSDIEIAEISKMATKMSDRHFGIGGDGIILICRSKLADFKMSMYNQDGSQAEMCGNGIRCVGKYVYDKGLTNKENIEIETLAGIKKLELHIDNNAVKSVTVNMGKPILQADLVPCIPDEKNDNKMQKIRINAVDKSFEFSCVSMGNPHAITVVDDVDNFDVEKYGKVIETDKHFPQKTNVEFIQIVDNTTVKMRVWERGTGETLACGTGASAVAVACILNKLVDENKEITINLLGGDLRIKWKDDVYMTGPAKIAFEGEYDG